MTICINCKFAEWRKTSTGRLHPSGDGRCRYKVVMPTLPASMYFVNTPSPSGGYIERKNGHETCPCFEAQS